MPKTPPAKRSERWVFPRPATLWRFVKDPQASVWKKGLVVATIAYVFWPADAVMDTLPVLGWLDDIGVVGLAIAYMGRVLAAYSSPRAADSAASQQPDDQHQTGGSTE